MSERRAPSATDAADKLQIYWNASSFSKQCQNFPFKHRLQLSNVINRKKLTKRKEQIVVTMHSSIQFRHKASSTYRVKGWRQSLIVQLQHTICAEGLLCLIFFSLVGRRLLIDMGCLHRELGTCQFSSISGLLNGGILLRVVCLIKFVSQTVSPVRPWKASTDSV